MSTGRWEQIAELFHAALALPADERDAFLREHAPDPAMSAEVQRLITAHERAGRFIEAPAISGADSLAARVPEPSMIGRRFGAYRVVREIGRGGMGAVYLAERADGEFEQRVAIKLIKRGMDTDLLLERFRSERQILATLDHPNIGRLLDGGATEDGRPYFVMEYIEGMPLDEYADAKRLPITQRLRLFLDVCSALTYAHVHHVVHRDIKPINIIVTADGVPKLLDFGIAKVLDPLTATTTTAVTGFRLLTPEYASPEQIDGRHATAASDVYSLGVILYELLTGHSPYALSGGDSLHVIAAVRTSNPARPSLAVTRVSDVESEPPRRRRLETDRAVATGSPNIDRLSRELRGDLDTIVLMALRKEPDRRYTSVEHLAADIRRHLDGLPVRARKEGARYRASKFVRRNRTSLMAAAVAGIAALAVAAGFTALRGAAGHEEPSLASTGAFVARDRIIVADFADHVGDTALAASISEAFRVELTQSPFVRVLSSRQLRSALVRMERSPDLMLDDTLAREIAVREGVKAFVTGSISRAGGRYSINSQLVSAERGDLLAAVHETARDSSDVIHAVDMLAEQLRRRMGESLSSIASSLPLEQVTTRSLPALRLYTEGDHAFNTGAREHGIALLQQAVALDTGFASAHRRMGMAYSDEGEPGLMTRALGHAIANQARLPFYERYHTIASYDYSVVGDLDGAIDAYHSILERYPDDVRALNNLGYVYGMRREFAVQESLLVRAMAIDSTNPSIPMSLSSARINQGHFDSARKTLERVRAKYPSLSNLQLSDIYLPAAQQDWDAAERSARVRVKLNAADSVDRMDGLSTLAGIVMTRGRLREAEKESREVMELSDKLGSSARYMASALRLGFLELRYRKAPDKAIAIVNQALEKTTSDYLNDDAAMYDQLAHFFAVAGRPVRARALVAQSEQSQLGKLRGVTADRRWSLGAIAASEGRVREAVPLLRQATKDEECPICTLPDLARAYDANGQRDSAIAVYERYVAAPFEVRFETDAFELGFAFERMGELYAAKGDAERAEAANNRLLALWSGADAELGPVIARVRRSRSTTGSRTVSVKAQYAVRAPARSAPSAHSPDESRTASQVAPRARRRAERDT
jgi:eukaryotic-like serine/threonine-protein kinase